MDKLSFLVSEVEKFKVECKGRTKTYPDRIKHQAVEMSKNHGVQAVSLAVRIPESLIYKWRKEPISESKISYSRIQNKNDMPKVVGRGQLERVSQPSKTVNQVYRLRHKSGLVFRVDSIDAVVELLSRLS